MSQLIAEVNKISDVSVHPNADKLEIAKFKGWNVVIAKGTFKKGDVVIHVPPDALLTRKLAERLKVDKYLSFSKESDYGRVRPVRLRGEMSFGFLVNPSSLDLLLPVGANAVDHLGIKKYEPPDIFVMGDQEREDPLFMRYSSIENFRNFPDVFGPSSEIVISEKIHGCNSRVGIKALEDGTFQFMCGSHNIQRKYDLSESDKLNIYQTPLDDKMKSMLLNILHLYKAKCVIAYGEIFGGGVQDLQYGRVHKDYRIFDIAINGKYLSHYVFESYAQSYDVRTVPILYIGKFDEKKLREFANIKTTLAEDQISEGIVFKCLYEVHHPKYGRRILKLKSDAYEVRKGGTEYK